MDAHSLGHDLWQWPPAAQQFIIDAAAAFLIAGEEALFELAIKMSRFLAAVCVRCGLRCHDASPLVRVRATSITRIADQPVLQKTRTGNDPSVPRPARGEIAMLNPDILHRDFTPTPFWWEAYRPSAGDLADVPREARVAIVGGGYAGLSAALELARNGIGAVVLEANELGFGASTRNGGAVSGGVNVGKSFTGRTIAVDPDHAGRILSDAADAFALIDRLIDEKRIDCWWDKSGRFVGAWTNGHFAGSSCSTLRPNREPIWCRATGSARRSPATIISAE
jgi:hypothetical protein